MSTEGLVELALERMHPVEGWLLDEEARLLADGAIRAFEADGEVVEVGSFCGRSTLVLATVAHEFGDVVHAIDPHMGDLGYPAECGEATWDRFNANVAASGLSDNVVAYRMPSWAVEFDRPIGFLYIDGLHHYEGCKADFWHFEPLYTQDVSVALHDYGHPEVLWDVKRAVDELDRLPGWRLVEVVGTMAHVRRA